jgi:type I restriction enzyme S subunit
VELKPGFKKTEAGLIPECWSVIDISKLCGLQRGFDLTEATSVPGTVPVYSSSGLSYYHNKAMVSSPGIVTGRKGILGKVFFIEEPFWPHDTTLWVSDFKGNHPAYVALVLRHFHLERLDAATSVPTLNRNNLVGYPIPYPPTKAEQHAIAEALSDADAFTGSLEQLIAKKRHIKQGAVQALLSPRDRCTTKKLLDIAPLQRGFDLPHHLLKNGRYPVVYSNGILNHHEHFMVKGPGLVTGRSGTLGVVQFINEDFWPHNTTLWVTDFKGNEPKFIYYLYSQIRFQKFGTGSGVPTLNRNDVHDLSAPIPDDPSEQIRIATILSDMDAEIAALEAKLAKARLIKQGMMQNLLTGRIRLV